MLQQCDEAKGKYWDLHKWSPWVLCRPSGHLDSVVWSHLAEVYQGTLMGGAGILMWRQLGKRERETVWETVDAGNCNDRVRKWDRLFSLQFFVSSGKAINLVYQSNASQYNTWCGEWGLKYLPSYCPWYLQGRRNGPHGWFTLRRTYSGVFSSSW